MTKNVKSICIGISFPGDAENQLQSIAKKIQNRVPEFINKLEQRPAMLKLKFCFEVNREQLKRVEEIVSSISSRKTAFLVTAEDFLVENQKISLEVTLGDLLGDLRVEIISELVKVFPEKSKILERGFLRIYIPKITLGIIPKGAENSVKAYLTSDHDFDPKNILRNMQVRNLKIFEKSFPVGEWQVMKKYKLQSLSFRVLAAARDAL